MLEAYGEMTPESRAQLDAWLAADDRHFGAYVRARAGLCAMEDAVVGREPPQVSSNDNDHEPVDVRRRSFGWAGPVAASGLALAASAAAFFALGVPLPPSRPPEAVAAQVLTLADGSVATLERGARIEFALSDGVRKITLLSGQATFKVAKDKAHPFVVRSGDVYAQATGTVYSVGRAGLVGGTVSVAEGSVLVWARDERDQAVLLDAGGTLTLDPGPKRPAPKAKAPPSLPPPELAQISLDNVSIGAAAARFNRVNATKIVIADPAIGETRIVGLFRANDPEQFSRFAAEITNAEVQYLDGKIVIKLK